MSYTLCISYPRSYLYELISMGQPIVDLFSRELLNYPRTTDILSDTIVVKYMNLPGRIKWMLEHRQVPNLNVEWIEKNEVTHIYNAPSDL